MKRAAVARLAQLGPEEQRQAVQELLATGRLPRWRGEREARLSLPRERSALALELVEKVGPAEAVAVVLAVLHVLQGRTTFSGGEATA